MAGHSKWSKVKRIKGPLDAKRNAAFSKLVKEITVAARLDGDPSGNPRLRLAVETARARNGGRLAAGGGARSSTAPARTAAGPPVPTPKTLPTQT